jgi:hypothetical protein
MLALHIDPIKESLSSELRQYWERLTERGSFRRALVVQDEAARDQGIDPTPAPLVGGP